MRQGLDVFFVFLVGVGKTAVGAPADLRLVGIDKDARVSQRTTTAVTGHYFLFHPAHRLLVDELDRCKGSWLRVVSEF